MDKKLTTEQITSKYKCHCEACEPKNPPVQYCVMGGEQTCDCCPEYPCHALREERETPMFPEGHECA